LPAILTRFVLNDLPFILSAVHLDDEQHWVLTRRGHRDMPELLSFGPLRFSHLARAALAIRAGFLH
jgi:hypothetical protein